MNTFIVDRKLAVLRRQLRAAQEEVERLRDGLDRSMAEAARLDAQVAVLEEIREQSASPAKEVSRMLQGKRKPSDAVRVIVGANPNISMKEIVEALDGQIDTAAENERHVIRTTLSNMTGAGKLIRHPDNTYSLPEN